MKGLFDTPAQPHPLTPAQLEALAYTARFAHHLFAALNPTGDRWTFWQNLLICANDVTDQLTRPRPVDWRTIRTLCEVGAGFIESVPATHNIHRLAPPDTVREVGAIAARKLAEAATGDSP